MNFEEFCDKNWPNADYYSMDGCYNALKIGWESCQTEVLKILEEEDGNYNLISKKIFERIEKL